MSEHINVMLKVTEKEVSLITSPLSFLCTHRTYHKHILFIVCYNDRVREPHVFIFSLVCLLHSYNCLVLIVSLRTDYRSKLFQATSLRVYVPHQSILVLCPRAALCRQTLEQPIRHQERKQFTELFILYIS